MSPSSRWSERTSQASSSSVSPRPSCSARSRSFASTELTEVTLARSVRHPSAQATWARFATLGNVEPLDHFDWSHPRAIDRDLYDELLTLAFLERGENVLLRGQAGVGKSTLAKHLGLAALAAGHSVRFTSLAGALADLLRQETLPAVERRLLRYTTPDLLILDELGYVGCEPDAADLLFRIVSRRHESRATVITTNLAYKHWPAYFRDAACLGALVDRFAQHCHVLDIDADSWRSKRPDRAARASPKSRRR